MDETVFEAIHLNSNGSHEIMLEGGSGEQQEAGIEKIN